MTRTWSHKQPARAPLTTFHLPRLSPSLRTYLVPTHWNLPTYLCSAARPTARRCRRAAGGLRFRVGQPCAATAADTAHEGTGQPACHAGPGKPGNRLARNQPSPSSSALLALLRPLFQKGLRPSVVENLLPAIFLRVSRELPTAAIQCSH